MFCCGGTDKVCILLFILSPENKFLNKLLTPGDSYFGVYQLVSYNILGSMYNTHCSVLGQVMHIFI